MNITEATKIIENGVLIIPQQYKIVEKEETKALIKVLDECRAIYSAYSVMSFPLIDDIIEQATLIEILNHQIEKKLARLYRFYARYYDIHFDDGDWGKENSEFSEAYRKQKATENNIALICETVESWDEQSSMTALFM